MFRKSLESRDREPTLTRRTSTRVKFGGSITGQLKILVQTLSPLQGSRGDIEKGFRDKLQAAGVDSPFFAMSEQIIYLWYIGAFFREKGPSNTRYWDYAPPQHCFSGKLWPVIRAKPPMTPHKQFAYWSKLHTDGA